MYKKVRSLVYGHRLSLLAFLAVLGLVAVPMFAQPAKNRQTIAPSTVIIDQATTVDQGVEVSWLESQSGTHKIAGYLIERSRGSNDFKQIGRVEKGSTDFLDPHGRTGDTYRVVAIDNQKPNNRSVSGEPVIAAPAPPGSVVIVRSANQDVLGAADKPNQKPLTAQNLDHAFKKFEQAAENDNKAYARNLLDLLQDRQNQILRDWSSLTGSEKVKLTDICKKHSDPFEASSHMLPEEYHFDSMLVKAGCDAIEDLSK